MKLLAYLCACLCMPSICLAESTTTMHLTAASQQKVLTPGKWEWIEFPCKDLLPAAEAAGGYLTKSTDLVLNDGAYTDSVRRLRDMADRIEAEDKVIQAFRDAIVKCKEEIKAFNEMKEKYK